MNIKEDVKMALGVVLFVPVILVEEGLKKAGAEINDKGWNYNKDGKSIIEIWREAGREMKIKLAEEKLINDMLEVNKPKTAPATIGFIIDEGM